MEVQPAVAGRLAIHRKILALGFELHAGGRHRHQLHTLAHGFKYLVHVPPDNGFHVAVAVHHLEEVSGIADDLLVQPGAAHRNGLVVKGNQHVPAGGFPQRLVQEQEFAAGEIARHFAANGGVEHDDLPVAHINDAGAHTLGDLVIGHDIGEIMIAGQPVHGAGEALHVLVKAGVGFAGAILRQVAGGQHQFHGRLLGRDQVHHLAQAMFGIQTQQLAFRILEQMAVG